MNAELMEDRQTIPTVLPVDSEEDEPVEANEESTLGLVELLLKSPARLDSLMNSQEERAPSSIPRFLSIALVSYLLFAFAMVVTLNTAPAAAYPRQPWLPLPPASSHDFSALA